MHTYTNFKNQPLGNFWALINHQQANASRSIFLMTLKVRLFKSWSLSAPVCQAPMTTLSLEKDPTESGVDLTGDTRCFTSGTAVVV